MLAVFTLLSTTVEIILYYLTSFIMPSRTNIYNSRNYSILLNIINLTCHIASTTVEIILYYLTCRRFALPPKSTTVEIILYYLTSFCSLGLRAIYNSRNYYILLNPITCEYTCKSTTVEIILYYLTWRVHSLKGVSTTVEIILYYLTYDSVRSTTNLQQ